MGSEMCIRDRLSTCPGLRPPAPLGVRPTAIHVADVVNAGTSRGASSSAGTSTGAPRAVDQPGAPPEPPGAKSAKAPALLTPDLSPSLFLQWRRTWNIYARLTRITRCPPVEQWDALISHFSLTMQEILFNNLDVDEDSELSAEEVLDRIQAYLREESNDLMDDLAFEERMQQEGEAFTAFLADLRHLYAASDGCAHCRDKRLRTRIVAGLRLSLIHI